MLLDQVQQPARAAEGGRHRGRERHLHRLRPDQRGRHPGRRLRRRQRRHLPDAGRDRGDAPAPAQQLHPGEPQEPRPLHQARRQDHPHRVRPAVRLQRRPDRPGVGADGQERGGCAGRRLFRLRRGGRVRQGGVHPGRLLQHPEDAGAGAARRRRPAHRPPARPAHRRSGELRHVRRPLRGVPGADAAFRRDQGARQQRHRAALRDLHARAVPLDPDRRLHRQGPRLSRRRPALRHHLHPGGRHRHDHRRAVGDQASRLRPAET